MTDLAAFGLAGSTADADPELVARLRAILDDPAPPASPLGISADDDALVAALGVLLPAARARHRREGIPEDITAATLMDVGRKQRLYGASSVLDWLVLLLRGDVVELGRLQVERRPGRYGHALHIPETGPLSARAVDDSLLRARRALGAISLSCESWLLDPALRAGLPGSNIATFAARFDIVGRREPTAQAADDAAKFVFRLTAADVRAGAVIPRTRLERLVAERLTSGAGWSAPLGILRASSPTGDPEA